MQVLKMTTYVTLSSHVNQLFIVKNFLVERCHQEFIFKEDGLFEISENKNPSKIMRYTVFITGVYLIMLVYRCLLIIALTLQSSCIIAHYN